MIKAFVLDLDGLTYDSEECKQAALNRLHAESGLPPWKVDAGAIASITPAAAFAVARNWELDEAEVNLWLAYSERIALKPGVLSLCHWAKVEGLLLGAASNGYRRRAEWVLERHGLLRLFDQIKMIDDLPSGISRAKPHPDLYQACMAALDVRPDEVVAFEDSPSGATSALAAGIHHVVVVPTTLTTRSEFPEGVLHHVSLEGLFPLSKFMRELD